MATVYDFLNPDSTEVEEQRIIRAPGATTGDVLTVQADKTVAPAPSSSAQPVGCVLATDAAPVSGGVNLNWSFLFDNVYDTNPLMALPAGIGFTTMFDGSDGTLTITANGWYAFTLFGVVDQDATWAGWLNPNIGQLGQNFSEGAVGAALATVTFVGYLPAGAVFFGAVGQYVAPTGNPTCAGNLVCARLA